MYSVQLLKQYKKGWKLEFFLNSNYKKDNEKIAKKNFLKKMKKVVDKTCTNGYINKAV